MTMWVVTGLHNDRWLENAIANFERQSCVNKRLILVANGDCSIDDSHCRTITGIVLLRSEKGPAQYMNRAIEWLRSNAQPDDWFAKCDADDYYGREYLRQIMWAHHCDYAGRNSLFVRTMDNKLWLLEGTANTAALHGPTLACRVGSALDFPIVDDWGEDQEWCLAMRDAGRTSFVLPPEGFCYQRWSNYQHTWPCTDEQLHAAWPIPFQFMGEFNEDVVNGIVPRPKGKFIPVPELTLDNSVAAQVLLKRHSESGKIHMKKILVPEHTVQGEEGKRLGLQWFVAFLINTDREFNADGVSIRSAMRIENAMGNSEATELNVDDQDWERLRRAAETPSAGYPVNPARAALPWVNAIAAAQ